MDVHLKLNRRNAEMPSMRENLREQGLVVHRHGEIRLAHARRERTRLHCTIQRNMAVPQQTQLADRPTVHDCSSKQIEENHFETKQLRTAGLGTIHACPLCYSTLNTCPSIDCDVKRSSTDLATSTSSIHNIAIVGHAESEHTSVLKLVFQRWKSEESGNLSKCGSEI